MSDDEIEKAARKYVQNMMTCEAIASAESLFQDIVGRNPTAEEERKIMERIDALLVEWGKRLET